MDVLYKNMISLLICIDNVEKYLGDCLESAISSSEVVGEIICIEGGSIDSSLEILEDYSRRDRRIKIISLPHSGHGEKINLGIKKAKCKYFMEMDGDDVLETSRLENLVGIAEENTVDVLMSPFYIFHNEDKSKATVSNLLKDCPTDIVFNAEMNPEIIFDVVAVWSAVYRTDFLKNKGIRLSNTPGASFQDSGFWFFVVINADRILIVNDPFYYYRIHEQSGTYTSSKNGFYEIYEANRKKRLLKRLGITDMKIYEAFARSLYILYKYQYNRMGEEYQYAFLMAWEKETKRLKRLGYLNKSLYSSNEWDEIQFLISDVDGYFENTSKLCVRRAVNNQTYNQLLYIKSVLDYIKFNKIIVFGNGEVAKELFKYLEKNNKKENVYKCCVSNPTTKTFCGRDIIPVNKLEADDYRYPVVVATKESFHMEIIDTLKTFGIEKMIIIDRAILNVIRGEIDE